MSRTDAHDPPSAAAPDAREDSPLPDEPEDESVLLESTDLADDSLAGQWMSSLDGMERAALPEVNDRTAAYDPPVDLFGAVPDPESMVRPAPPVAASSAREPAASAPPPTPAEASAPSVPPVSAGPIASLGPPPGGAPESSRPRVVRVPSEDAAAPPARDPHISVRATAFMPAMQIDPALAQRMRPPTQRNLVPEAARVARPIAPSVPPIPVPEESEADEALDAPPPRPAPNRRREAQAAAPARAAQAAAPPRAAPAGRAAPAPSRSVPEGRGEPAPSRAAPPSRPAPAARSAPAARAAPPRESARSSVEDDALPSVVFVPENEAADDLEVELTGIYEPPKPIDLPRARLVIVAGENSGKTYYLNRAQVHVGRGTDNDVVLLDIAVSRRHLRIERHGDGFRLVDLQSGNGTIVNGRRVQECELFDGDRIEVGNSILDFTSVGRPRRREEQPPVTDPAARATPPLAVRAGNRSVPFSWLLLWFGTTLAAVLLGVFVARLVTGDTVDDDQAVREKAAAAYDRAASAMRAKDWKRADEELKVARQLAPDLFDYTADLGRVERARTQEGQLNEARRLVGEAPPDDVRAAVKSIGADSPYHAEAVALVADAERRWLDRQIERAEALLRDDKRAAARALAEEVLARDAGNARARAIIDGAPAAAPSAPAPASSEAAAARPASAPAAPAAAESPDAAAAERKAKADLQEAMRLYREEQFSNAAALLERAGRGTGESARKARDRARHVKAFGEAWGTAGRAVRSRRPDEAVEAYERALEADARLGGIMRGRVTAQLAEQHYLRAIREFSRQNYEGAVSANDRVLQLAPGHALGTQLAEKMGRTASDLVRKARDARDDEPDRARRLARQAMALARRSDPAFLDAQRLLRTLD